jgi:outer membrane protein
MKKIIVMLFAISLVFSTGLYAEIKIGVVDMQKALDESDAGKAAVEQMKRDYEKMQEKINIESEKLKKLQDELNNQSGLLTEEAKQKKLDEYQKKLKEVQRLVKDSNDEMKSKEQQLVMKIGNELADLAIRLGQELKYDIILEAKEAGVIYNSKAVDMTDILIERYNREWRSKK